MEIIFCASNSKRFTPIAIENGWLYGARLPGTVHAKLYFSDQKYQKPNRIAYMKAVKEHKPNIASVIDWEKPEQYQEVMDWAFEVSEHTNQIMIIPKVSGMVEKIPETINGKKVILGFSIPTSNGATNLLIWEFSGREIHLLGGSPENQYEYFMYLNNCGKVVSLDCNYTMMKAGHCQYWKSLGKWVQDNYESPIDAPYKCFEKTMRNLYKFWKGLG